MLEIVAYSRAPAHGMASTASNSVCTIRYGSVSVPTTFAENARSAGVNTMCGACSARYGFSAGSSGVGWTLAGSISICRAYTVTA
ncbi:hypothetical protein D3C71_1822720 [compost metagenome]